VFTTLFHDRHHDPYLKWPLCGIDFNQVTWTQEDHSGRFKRPSMTACRDIVDNDVIHEREDVVASWRKTGTWIEPPILLSGSILGTAVRDYLLVGSTRLGCVLAFLDQGVVTESAQHQVWVGRSACRGVAMKRAKRAVSLPKIPHSSRKSTVVSSA
jgi:hypothetical protein